jgi:predicted transcriptional regulator
MQLDKVVNYHKALADPTRIKLLILLVEGEQNGQMIADRLGVSTATITHHASKLREVGLIKERREKNTIFFSIDYHSLKFNAEATMELIYKSANANAIKEGDTMEHKNNELKRSVLKNFFTAEGKLKHLPAQLKKKLIVLEYLVNGLEKGRKYTEQEINAFIKNIHHDYATIRREFIMHQFMFREHEIYELNPPELWTKWNTLQ